VRGLVLIVIMLGCAKPVAQTPSPRTPPMHRNVPKELTGTVRGQVLDSATQSPLANAFVEARLPARHGRELTDSAGEFLLDWVEPGEVLIDVHCPTHTSFGELVLTSPTKVDTGQTVEVELRVDATRCNEPAPGTRRVHVRGRYTSAFEQLEFTPCRDDEHALDSIWGGRKLQRAWIEIADSSRLVTPDWPRGNGDNYQRWWYIEVAGELTGPGRHGHMGVSPYRLEVDTVFAVRTRIPSECNLSGE
jgi:hypothetical protein